MTVFAEGRTDAVFQFESSGMQEICRKLRPKGVEDLAALNALYRPGPLDGGMVEEFIQRHHGKKSVRYLVPEMKEILNNTYGIIVYQEQIMQLAQKLAGYSLSEADLMRRAMGKKKREEMAVHEQKFIDGAVERGIKRDKAEKIFSLMAQFSDYGFNRSHSVAYAYLAFQTAYLKAHFPEHFYAAVLSSEAHDAAKVFKYSKELRAQSIQLLPPDVNESNSGFTPLKGAIRYGLAAIKGLGQSTVTAVIEARQSGPFRSFFDFAERVDTAALNRRGMEGLVSAGAFDTLNPNGIAAEEWRGVLFNSVDVALARGQRARREREQGQNGLFGGMPVEEEFIDRLPPTAKGWTRGELLAAEKATLGFYITGHPLDRYLDLLESLKSAKSVELSNLSGGSRISIVGIVADLQLKTTRKGDRFAILRLEDEAGGTKCVLWPDTYRRHSVVLQNEAAVVITGRLELSEDGPPSVIADQVQSLDSIIKDAEVVVLRVPTADDFDGLFDSILHLLNMHPGNCDVALELLVDGKALVRIKPNSQLRVDRSQELVVALKHLGCEVSAERVSV